MGRRHTQTPDYLDMVERVVRAAGDRVGKSDPEDLTRLMAIDETVHRAIRLAIAGQRSTGITWDSIGEAMGMSAPGALMWTQRHDAREEKAQ